MSDPAFGVRLAGGIDAIDAARWDSLCPDDNPFTSHRFLALMERSRSAAPRTGWQPVHLAVEAGDELKAVMPLYLKGHSWGEYVFDHAWAQAYERAGGDYYPKLQAAVPFTPVPGPRLLGQDDVAQNLLAHGLKAMAGKLGVSSAHVTFCTEAEAAILEGAGFMRRRGIQYHWHNRGYRDFDDFLEGFRSAKRKMVKKERREAQALGVRIEVVEGAALTGDFLAAFYPFYEATVDRRWGSAYLTKAFFRELGRTMPDDVVMIAAFAPDGEMVAGALNLRAGDTLYGRLWGALDAYRFLHFECCYYKAIEFAIERGIARVEAGAQGMHKLQRGYEPVFTHSAHHVADPALAVPVRRFLEAEWAGQQDEIVALREALPFRVAGEG